MAWGFDASVNRSGTVSSGSQATSGVSTDKGTVTTGKKLSQEGIDQIIYSLMSSANGMSDLLGQENLVGGSSSSTKTLQTQDFMAKLGAEIANITAQTVQTTDMTKAIDSTTDTKASSTTKDVKASGGLKTIICTRLMELQYISRVKYIVGNAKAPKPSDQQLAGYHLWAKHIVPLLGNKNVLTTCFFIWLVNGRYDYYIHGRKSLAALISIKILSPFSSLLGYLFCREVNHGRQPV